MKGFLFNLAILVLPALPALLAFTPAGSCAEGSGEVQRQKSIQFEDGLVEGLGQGKGNIGALITKSRDKRRPHIYDRSINFAREKQESIREFRYQP